MTTNSGLTVVGAGNMGMAIIESALRNQFQVSVYEQDPDRLESLNKDQLQLVSHTEEISAEQPVLIAVKPGQFKDCLKSISLKPQTCVISIAAGVSLDSIQRWRNVPGPCIRAMPNTPLQIGYGMTVFSCNEDVSQDERDFCQRLFAASGMAYEVQKEELLHAVTAVSGSGPAYVFLFLQAMEDAAVSHGLTRELARQLSLQTVLGSAQLMKEKGLAQHDLIQQVTSPGGTTIAGLLALKENGFEAAVHAGITAAKGRSVELGSD